MTDKRQYVDISYKGQGSTNQWLRIALLNDPDGQTVLTKTR